MSKELLLVIETVANEKEFSKSFIFAAMEEALLIATKKTIDANCNIIVKIDKKLGTYKTFRKWKVVKNNNYNINKSIEISLTDALKMNKNIKLNDTLEVIIDSVPFSRIAAMTAKQILMQKVRVAEIEKIILKYNKKIGTIVYGQVKRITRDFLIIDLGENAEGFLSRKELLPKEYFRLNDRLRSCIISIQQDIKSYKIILSRTHKEMLKSLLILEVPEIAEEIIEIVKIERDPGSRAKVAVKTNDKRIDPVGSCVGIRGSRIQAIINELQGEKIDIILWDENPIQFVINSLANVDIVSIVQDEEKNLMEVAIKEEELAQSIGRYGQNVRLSSALTGWNIKIVNEKLAKEENEKKFKNNIYLFINSLDIEKDIAIHLIKAGFSSIEEIAYVDFNELLKIKAFDKELCIELQERSKTALISQVLQNNMHNNLSNMKNIKKEWLCLLEKNKILTIENLAELSLEDLKDIISNITDNEASSLIMEARKPWFNNDQEKNK